MKLGCSYFGNRILRHVREDMRELVDMGCTYVVHTFNENDWMFYHKTMGEIVEVSHELGLEVHIDPWGVGKVFGGESFSNFVMQNTDALQMISDGRPAGNACPNHPKFRKFMREWIDAAAETRSDVLFWDEPHFYLSTWLGGRPDTYGCLCKACHRKFEEMHNRPFPSSENDELKQFKEDCVVEFLTELIAYGHESGLRNSLCVLPSRDESHGTGNWPRMASIPHLDIFGTDPYWIIFKKDLRKFVGDASRQVKQVCNENNLQAQVWIQGYKIPSGHENEVVEATVLAHECGVEDIAVWGFDACRHISWIRPDNPELVWAKVKEAWQRVRS